MLTDLLFRELCINSVFTINFEWPRFQRSPNLELGSLRYSALRIHHPIESVAGEENRF